MTERKRRHTHNRDGRIQIIRAVVYKSPSQASYAELRGEAREMVTHPEQLGFVLGLKIRIGQDASMVETDVARKVFPFGVVYVALFADQGTRLKKGDALKIGQTAKSLKSRWALTLGIFKPGRKLRGYEIEDRDEWLAKAQGKEVCVWMKPAGEIKIPYAEKLTRQHFSTRLAEEEFLDWYYCPRSRRRHPMPK